MVTPVIRVLRLRLPRLAAAALAVLGLMASSARGVLACTMPAGHPMAAVAEAVPMAAHAHHLPAPAPDPDAPEPADESCPDLAHCAVVAWTPLPPTLPERARAVAGRIPSIESRPLSVGGSIDTPPPKRG
jgi:hypothetical protein